MGKARRHTDELYAKHSQTGPRLQPSRAPANEVDAPGQLVLLRVGSSFHGHRIVSSPIQIAFCGAHRAKPVTSHINMPSHMSTEFWWFGHENLRL